MTEIVTTYHVFTDNTDEYCDTLKQAKTIYKDWRENGYDNIRLYKEKMQFDGDIVEEILIACRGQWPQ